MRKPVASYGDHYEIAVDGARNRMYLTIKGYWASASAVPNYLRDIRKAIGLSTLGLAILADPTSMTMTAGDVGIPHQKAQKLCAARGLGAGAEVCASATAKMSADRFNRNSGIRKRVFSSVGLAGFPLTTGLQAS